MTVTPCNLPIRIGLFFDGTNNNLARDLYGERVAIGGHSVISGGERTQESECSHSNVARLFQAYGENDFTKGFFSYYLPGVGTRFVEVGELTETSDGKAFAKGGQARIIYALLQIINSIYITIVQDPLYTPKEMGAIALAYDRATRQNRNGEEGTSNSSAHVSFFEEYISTLTKTIAAHPKPVIPSVTLNVFGFSRGAAQAISFCHMFDELLENKKFATIPASINFLGVFDTVASVGISASVSRTTLVPKFLADGHHSWAARILEALPPSVRSGRHYIAAHEQRMNFPVTTQIGKNFKEFYFPGVHSDVGGGYGPGEGGKGRHQQANLLSQIPLAYMYKEACMEGVPFLAYEDLPQTIKNHFLVSEELASRWNAYCNELKSAGGIHRGGLQAHMGLYYYWRAARLETLEQTEFFMSATKQAQQDLIESNRVLKGDLKMIQRRATSRNPEVPVPTVDKKEGKTISLWHVSKAHMSPDSWEQWAASCFTQPKILSSAVMDFFDNHVHDSIAGFYLAGEVTEYDKRVKVDSVMKMRPEQMKKFDKSIFTLTTQVNEAVAKKKRSEQLSSTEEALVKEAETGTPYPVMTDDDTEEMRNAMIATQTSSRREGGGYLLKREYFPRNRIIEEVGQKNDEAPLENVGGAAA